MLGDHCLIAVVGGHLAATLNKDSKQVCFAVGVVLFDKVVDVGAEVAGSGIGGIGAGDPILPCHGLAKVDELLQLLGGLLHTGTFQRDLHLIVNATYKPAQQCPVILRYIEDGAVLLGISEDVQQTLQLHFGGVLFQVRKARPKKLEVSPVDGVALLNGVDVAGVFAVEDAAVVLPCLHHYGKVCQLIGTVVNIQTIEIVFEDALGGIPLGVAHAGVNLHQHVKGVHQNMAGAHAGVDEGQVLRIQGGVLFTNFCKLCLHLRLLRGFVQIILPVFPQVAVRVTLYPQAAKAVFHHVADDPVRGEQLGHGGNFLFGDLAVFGKGGGFRLGVVILVQPADDLHLTALLDVEILFRDVVSQLVHHALLIHHRKVQQDFGVVGGLFKQTGQDLIQRIALPDEQKAEQLIQLVVLLPLDDPGFFLGGKGQLGIKGGGDQIRLHLAALGGKHPQVGG